MCAMRAISAQMVQEYVVCLFIELLTLVDVMIFSECKSIGKAILWLIVYHVKSITVKLIGCSIWYQKYVYA